jgi:hypothetical protein
MSVIDARARLRSWATDMVVAWFPTHAPNMRGGHVTSIGPDMSECEGTQADVRRCRGQRSGRRESRP